MFQRMELIGNLGNEPEVRASANGTMVGTISVATSERWKDRSGQQQEHTEWHRCVAFGKTAELMGQLLAKGRQVFVAGRLRTRKWKDDAGIDRWTTEIIIDTFRVLGPKTNGNRPPAPTEAGGGGDGGGAGYTGGFGVGDDDIPF